MLTGPAILGKTRYEDRNLTPIIEDFDGRTIRVVGFKVYRLYDLSIEYYGIRLYTVNKRQELEKLAENEWGDCGAWHYQ